jgi:hypothetical protein
MVTTQLAVQSVVLQTSLRLESAELGEDVFVICVEQASELFVLEGVWREVDLLGLTQALQMVAQLEQALVDVFLVDSERNGRLDLGLLRQ